MDKKNILIFSLGIVLSLAVGFYSGARFSNSEQVRAYNAKPAAGHSWSEMECSSGLCVTSDNKVGVGTDSPTEKMQVAGNLKVTGDICNSSGNCLSALASLTNACGTAAKTYLYTDTAYAGTFCLLGAPTPASPTFPSQGSSTNWTCPVLHGTAISCTASRNGSPVNGTCGSSSGTSSYSAPSSSLCSSGTATSVSASGYSWIWSCAGSGGGSTASCAANRIVDGQCGGSGPYGSLSSGSCNVGTAANFSGSGDWSWNCIGVNGGSTASCSASYGHTSCACEISSSGSWWEGNHIICSCKHECPSGWRIVPGTNCFWSYQQYNVCSCY